MSIAASPRMDSAAEPFKNNKKNPGERKLRGGYYTPRQLSDYLSKWAIRHPGDCVLEPSCGDGNIIVSAAACLGETGMITAVEIVGEELEKAQKRPLSKAPTINWRCGSFFQFFQDLKAAEKFDAVIGNPPFVRFQYFDKRERALAFSMLNAFGYRPNGLANAWAAFVALSAELLKPGGRLAMVVPAELLQVQYAAELRQRLPALFDEVLVIAFKELVFPEIQQEVLLLLADGRNRDRDKLGQLRTLEVRNGQELPKIEDLSRAKPHLPERHANQEMKWTSLFLEVDEFEMLRGLLDVAHVKRLGDYAEVDVGIVTGRNSFFVVDEGRVQDLAVDEHAVNVVGRTAALKSIRFTHADFREFGRKYPSKLLSLRGLKRDDFPIGLERYVKAGEQQGVHKGYKCRIRQRWFDVPSVYVPDAFLFRQIHNAPLLVANHAEATSTDTIHRVRVSPDIAVERLCGAMVNSLTFAWSEVVGRSYGGGVLELEPREAERIPVPYSFAGDLDLDYIDRKLRAGDILAALDHGDRIMLHKGCGYSPAESALARSAWMRLRDRRQTRR
ncbi:MAG: N-6 DNA methylase [Gammaproteobacteria bacterium]|nr:N-6 DNA methylase [Gammaproteobacteria bacterium]